MGRSDKKVKAECVNKLRKRYDAFLEEDRRRKERNEEILTKLDKMRNTVVPYKANVHLNQREPFNSFGDTSSSIRRYFEPQMPAKEELRSKHIDESYILSEISKKYILIPKLRAIVDNDYSPKIIRQDNNDTDWKSKYSILDELKQNEKEEAIYDPDFNNRDLNKYADLSSEPPKYSEDDKLAEVSKDQRNSKNIRMDLDTVKSSHTPITRQEDNLNMAKNYLNKPEIQPLHKTDSYESRAFKVNSELKNNSKDNNFISSMEAHSQPKRDTNEVIPSKITAAPLPVIDIHEQVEHDLYQNIAEERYNSGDDDSKHETEDTEKSFFEGDISHVEVVNPAQEIANENANTDFQEINYPIDVINVPDFTPGDEVTLEDGVNINPEGHAAEQAYFAQSQQPHVPETLAAAEQDKVYDYDTSSHQYVPDTETVAEQQAYAEATHQYGLETQAATEHKQAYVEPSHQYIPETVADAGHNKDITYQEPVNVTSEQITNEGDNDPNQQYDTTTSDQVNFDTTEIQAFEAEQNEMFYSEQPNAQNYDEYNQGTGYDAGYTGQMEGYDPTAYYEGTQQGGEYPVEINEHEETSQRYDPSYEQQYVTTDMEQQQYTEGDQPQFEPVLEPTQLVYDQSHYEQQETVEQVEQQLDSEAGYVVEQTSGNIRDEVNESVLYQENLTNQDMIPENET